MSIIGDVGKNDSVKSLRGKISSIPQTDETLSKKGLSADAKVVGDALKERIKYTDIIDNLTTDDPNKPASSRQVFLLGKQLASINLSEASTVGYNNANSGLNASNMQGAIDEVAQGVKNSVSQKGNSMIEGVLHIRNAENGYGSFSKNNSATEDYGTQLIDVASNGKTAKMNVSAALNLLTFVDNTGNIRDIFHEGNKPFGSYEGNGIENERIIDTKGISRLMLVYNQQYFSFVTPEGALVVKLATGAVSWIPSTKVFFLNGKLTLHTVSSAFNEVDVTYHYQVI